MALQDVNVVIDTLLVADYTAFGKPLIIAEKAGLTAPTIKDYANLTAVSADFASGTAAYAKAKAIFDQDKSPAKVSIAAFDPAAIEGANTFAEVADLFYDNDWVFALTAGADVAEMIAVADLVEIKRYKMFVALVTAAGDRATFKAKEYERTVVFFHTVADQHPDAAVVGGVGNLTVGSVTWKFKTLEGITPIDVTPSGLEAIHNDGAIAYVTKAGKQETSGGHVVSGEWIDVIHGKDWIKFNLEMAVQKALSNSEKVPYNNNGIAMFEDAAVTVLEKASAQGIVDKDDAGNPRYTITAADRASTSTADRAARSYNGLAFSYYPEGAIHDADIKGEIIKEV